LIHVKEKFIKSDVSDRIIKQLSHFKELSFSDLISILDTSAPTLSRHLKSLSDMDVIIFESRGREKYYKLTPHVLERFDTKLNIISENYRFYFETEIKPSPDTPFDKSVTLIKEMLFSLFIYTLMNSMRDGKNWTKAFNIEDLTQETIEFMINTCTGNDEKSQKKLLELSRKSLDDFFKESGKLCKVGSEYSERLTYFLEYLEEHNPADLSYLQTESKDRKD
jgi:DNA-binding transcriptional ArsR family regulator